MKYLNIGILGLFLVGFVQADTPLKFKSELVGEANYKIFRTVDNELNVACYHYYTSVSCVKL